MYYSIIIQDKPTNGSFTWNNPFISIIKVLLKPTSDALFTNINQFNTLFNIKCESIMFDKRYYSLAHIIQYPMLIPVMLVFTLDSSDMSKNDYSQLSSFITLIPSNVSVLTFIRLSLTFLCSCSTDSTCFERSRQNRIITTITMILSSLTHLNYTSSILQSPFPIDNHLECSKS